MKFDKDTIAYRLLARGCETHKQYRGKTAPKTTPKRYCPTCHMIRRLALEYNIFWQEVEVIPYVDVAREMMK